MVPFDSLRKRVFQAAGAEGPVPGATASSFLSGWLRDGTGGSCWSTSSGLHALLKALGFDARLVFGVMLTDPDTRPNHGTVLVDLDERTWLVDSSMLFDRPFELPSSHGGTHRPDPVHPVGARRLADDRGWLVEWRPAHSELVVGCEISLVTADPGAWDQAHDRTRGHSLFNQSLYARLNTIDGIIAYGRNKLVNRDRSGQLATTHIADDEVARMLVDTFGYSASFVENLPGDELGPAFL